MDHRPSARRHLDINVLQLAREHPRDWHSRIQEATPVPPPAALVMLVRMALVATLVDQVLPRHAGPTEVARIKRYRASIRRLLGVVGRTSMERLDNAKIGQLMQELLAGGAGRPAYSPATVSRDISLLRRTAVKWAERCGLEPKVSHGREWATQRRREQAKVERARRESERAEQAHAPQNAAEKKTAGTARTSRFVPTTHQLSELLERADSMALRVAIALAAGAGLRQAQIRYLKLGQLLPRERALTVWTSRSMPGVPSGAMRKVWLAGWAWDLLEPQLQLRHAMGMGRDALLLPQDQREAPRAGFNRALAAAADPRVAFLFEGERVGMASLRRFYQAVAREAGMPRAVVRGTWWMVPDKDGQLAVPRAALAARDLAHRWSTLFCPLTASMDLVGPVVPRAAPKGVGPWEPELKVQQALPPLPASCGGEQEGS